MPTPGQERTVMTGNLAFVYAGTPGQQLNLIAKATGITLTETFIRGRVRGLGNPLPQEVPLLQWEGAGTMTLFLQDFYRENRLPGIVNREVSNNQQFREQIVLRSPQSGLLLAINRLTVDEASVGSGTLTGTQRHWAVVRGIFLEGEGIVLQQNETGGQNLNFVYIQPVLNEGQGPSRLQNEGQASSDLPRDPTATG